MSRDLPKPLGRWRTEHCNIQMNQKIDLSNEDHCGPCGQYVLEKQKNKYPENKDPEVNINIPKNT